MEDLLVRLEPVDNRIFELKTREVLTDKDAKDLVDKNIHFTWWNKKEKSMMTLPGKVIGYEDGKLKIFTYSITFEDDSVDEEHNKMIEVIPIDEIEDYMTFDNYTKEFWNLTEIIECDGKDQPLKKIYKVENIFGESVDCIIEMFDSFSIAMTYKLSNGDVVRTGYPLYFVKSIEEKKFN